jgi:ATP-binding cassette subfamily B protein
MKKSIRNTLAYLLLIAAAALIFSSLNGLLSIYMMKSIDAVTSGDRALFNKEVYKLLLVAFVMIPATLLLAFTRGLFKRKAIVTLKVGFIKGLFSKNIDEFQGDNNSKYISALTNDINTIESGYIDGLYELIVNAAGFVVGIVVISFISPIALGLGFAIGFVSTVISLFVNKPLKKHQVQRSKLYEDYTAYIKEALSAFHIIKSNNLNDKVHKDFYHRSHAIQQKSYVIDKLLSYSTSLQRLNIDMTLFSLLGVCAVLAIRGELTLGGSILIINNMDKIIMPLTQIGEWLPKVFAAKPIFAKLEDTLKNQDDYQEKYTLEGMRKSLDISEVTFAYEDNEVLRDISLSLKKGGKYLIVGPSGGGKSTLLKLLRKYYRPVKGDISIDGQNLKDITKESYFKHISNVEQQVFLFEDTVRNNISLYKEYTEEELNLAIEQAGLRDFVNGLPQGLDTIIYDNGKNISGGEKSRIAVARGLLQKADLLFLDEAFASLDSNTARAIESTLLELKDITVVNVSHVVFEENRDKYDKIFVVKNKNVYIA